MDRRYLAAATFAGIGAALHLIALALSGFADNYVASLLGGAIWFALAFGLLRGWRSIAYLTFLMALFGISAALSIVMVTPSGPVQWAWISIMVADGLVAFTLFALLWRPPAP
ncbi:MAG: hypothetical protein JKY00_12735 [Roseicyclus sp.]|nr:hypothetical protein [Roseicyclus sp.]